MILPTETELADHLAAKVRAMIPPDVPATPRMLRRPFETAIAEVEAELDRALEASPAKG